MTKTLTNVDASTAELRGRLDESDFGTVRRRTTLQASNVLRQPNTEKRDRHETHRASDTSAASANEDNVVLIVLGLADRRHPDY